MDGQNNCKSLLSLTDVTTTIKQSCFVFASGNELAWMPDEACVQEMYVQFV